MVARASDRRARERARVNRAHHHPSAICVIWGTFSAESYSLAQVGSYFATGASMLARALTCQFSMAGRCTASEPSLAPTKATG